MMTKLAVGQLRRNTKSDETLFFWLQAVEMAKQQLKAELIDQCVFRSVTDAREQLFKRPPLRYIELYYNGTGRTAQRATLVVELRQSPTI